MSQKLNFIEIQDTKHFQEYGCFNGDVNPLQEILLGKVKIFANKDLLLALYRAGVSFIGNLCYLTVYDTIVMLSDFTADIENDFNIIVQDKRILKEFDDSFRVFIKRLNRIGSNKKVEIELRKSRDDNENFYTYLVKVIGKTNDDMFSFTLTLLVDSLNNKNLSFYKSGDSITFKGADKSAILGEIINIYFTMNNRSRGYYNWVLDFSWVELFQGQSKIDNDYVIRRLSYESPNLSKMLSDLENLLKDYNRFSSVSYYVRDILKRLVESIETKIKIDSLDGEIFQYDELIKKIQHYSNSGIKKEKDYLIIGESALNHRVPAHLDSLSPFRYREIYYKVNESLLTRIEGTNFYLPILEYGIILNLIGLDNYKININVVNVLLSYFKFFGNNINFVDSLFRLSMEFGIPEITVKHLNYVSRLRKERGYE